MAIQVLINETIKQYMLQASRRGRKELRKSFEYLEAGLWDGGLCIKKLWTLSKKVILEARTSLKDRMLITLGKDNDGKLLVYVWGIVAHDDVNRKVRSIIPANAPYLNFTDYEELEMRDGADLEKLESSCINQERIEEKTQQESGPQKWFILDDAAWKRKLLFIKANFDIVLFLTEEQKALLTHPLPILLSGTAGSGKTTLAVYYLLKPVPQNYHVLFLTYNKYLKNFSEKLYYSLVSFIEREHQHVPEFITFKELCFSIIPEAGRLFKEEKEIDAFEFANLFKKHKASMKFDSALVWEEIRSIIKGEKPQVSIASLKEMITAAKEAEIEPDIIRMIRDEILKIQNLGIYEKAERAMRNSLGKGLSEVSHEIEKFMEKQRHAFISGMYNILGILSNYEANLSLPLMTLLEYEQLGRKWAPNFLYSRREIHAIAQWYQNKCQEEGLWDEIDLTRHAIREIDRQPLWKKKYWLVCCDEIQDFTDLQMSLIMRLPVFSNALFLAGDTKQIINPSGFRWEVRELFFDRGMAAPEVHHLTLNFRCVGSIVLLSNALLELKRKILGIRHDESLDEWKMQGWPPFVVYGINEQIMLRHLNAQAASQVILTRSREECNRFKLQLGTELVFTIREAKGLEFKTVLLWKFCSEADQRDAWEKILGVKESELHEAFIRHEIDLLYVGATRAQQNLIIYEGAEHSFIWRSEYLRDYVLRTSNMELFQQAWFSVSSPPEWKEQDDYFFERDYFKAAAECYRNAEEKALMNKALAMYHEKQHEYSEAAKHWEDADMHVQAARAYEKAGEYAHAAVLWELLDKKRNLMRCQLLSMEKEGKYNELAEMMWGQKKEKEAVEYWKKAQNNERIGAWLERKRKYKEAAENYRKAELHEKAAVLFLKVKDMRNAATCYERGGNYGEALQLWKKLKEKDGMRRCLLQINDELLLGRFYEQEGAWDEALKAYQQSLNPQRLAELESEIAAMPKGKQGYPMLAIRYTLLQKPQQGRKIGKRCDDLTSQRRYLRKHNFIIKPATVASWQIILCRQSNIMV